MNKNSEATNKICKLLTLQSKLIKQFDYEMQVIINQMLAELGEEPIQEELIKEGISKALNKNVISLNTLKNNLISTKK